MIMVSNTIKTAPFSSQDQQGVWEARPSRDPTMQNATTMQQVVPAEPDEWHSGEKTALFVHFYIKMILPRQARDKHRKNSKKSAVFFQLIIPASCGGEEIRLNGGRSIPRNFHIETIVFPRQARDKHNDN